MEEFDDILRRKLNEPATPPDLSPVWSKVNAGLGSTGYNIWKTIALLSILLWFLSFLFWFKGKEVKQNNVNNKQIPLTQTSIHNDTIISYKTIRDTVFRKVYINKWKGVQPGPIAITSENKEEPSQLNTEHPINTEKRDTITSYISTINNKAIQSTSMDYQAKMKALTPEKPIENNIKPNKLPVFDFVIFAGIPHYQELVLQKDGIAPKESSSVYGISTNYRLLKGLSFYGGITRQKDSYEAGAITSIKNREIPDPGNPSYLLDAITVDQSIWALNTGISYDFLLKNKWILCFGAGVDWILSGRQDNSFCFPGIAYLPEQRIYEHQDAKPFTAHKSYISLGFDIPVFKQLSFECKLKKYFSIHDQPWLVPDYTSELGLKYNFY